LNWYRLNVKEVLEKLSISEERLESEVLERLEKYGSNKLARRRADQPAQDPPGAFN